MVKYVEFQAVIVAGGKGSRMTELTVGKPKCLLPINNLPMIYYPLNLLEKTGFSDVIVITTENMKKEVSLALDKLDLNIKMDLVGIPDGEDLGTADAIQYIYDKIYTDLIVLSCDLITDIDINDIFNSYRKYNASITALMFPTLKVASNFITPGPKNKQKPETDLIGIDNKTNRLVFLASASDFEETINMSQRLLRKHTSFTMHSKLMDAHFYIIKKWVIDFLNHNNKNFGTLKGELLPYIVNKQLIHQRKQIVDDKNASAVKLDTKQDIFRFAIERKLDELIRKMSAFNDHYSDLDGAFHGDLIKCYAHITDQFGLRANTIQMYTYANHMMSGLPVPRNFPVNGISPLAVVKSTQITDCRVDEGAFIDEKTSLKLSKVGPGSIVHPKTRIINSIIMGNVTIKEKCVIENCILSNNCVIEEGTELKHCLVGAQHTVPAANNFTHEVLTEADRLMEI